MGDQRLNQLNLFVIMICYQTVCKDIYSVPPMRPDNTLFNVCTLGLSAMIQNISLILKIQYAMYYEVRHYPTYSIYILYK